VLGLYVHAFDPSFQGLTGDAAVIGRLAATFGVAVNRVDLPGGNYTMDHTAVVFLLDDAARIVAIFTPPFEVAALMADLKRAAPYLGHAPPRSAT
jgi:protein SCO1